MNELEQQLIQDGAKPKGIRTNELGNDLLDVDKYEALKESINNFSRKTDSWNGQNYADRLTNGNVIQLDKRYDGPLADYGSSRYDEDTMFDPTADKIQNQRFENQSGLTQIGAGLAKGVVTAGTTFVDGVAMLTLGVAKGIKNKLDDDPNTGFIDGMWNNEVTKTMQSINELSEDIFKNYYSTNQERGAWYSMDNILSANFLGDKILKNMGFMVGAYGSGAVLTAGKLLPKALGALTKSAKVAKTVAAIDGSLISAISEGGIEALNNSTEWKKAQIKTLDDNIQKELLNLEILKPMLSEEEYQLRLANIQNTKNQTLQQIDIDAVRMGNLDMLLNLPILTAENMFAWGKLYSSGFKDATKFGNIAKNIRTIGEGGGRNLLDGGIKAVENTIKHPLASGAGKGVKRSVMEGLEEMHQAAASEYSGLKEQQDVDNYFKAALNGEAYERTYDEWKAVSEALKNTYGNGDQWEEFAIGAISSVFGMPKVRGVRNEAGKFQSPITFEGGIVQDVKDANNLYREVSQVVDYVNKSLADPKFKEKIQGATAHNYFQKLMDDAATVGNKEAFKDAESAQFISDIYMFHKAGLLNEMAETIKTASDFSNLKFDDSGNLLMGNENSEADKNNLELIKSNDKVKNEDGTITSQRGWFDKDGNQKVSDKAITEDITSRKEKLLKYIDKFKDVSQELDYMSNGVLSDDQLKELTWAQMNRFAKLNRSGSMLNKLFNMDPNFKEPSFLNLKNEIDNWINKLSKKKNRSAKDEEDLLYLREASEIIDEASRADFSDLENDKKSKKVSNVLDEVTRVIDKYQNFDNNKKAIKEFKTAKDLITQAYDFNRRYEMYLNNPGLLEKQIMDIKKQAENENINKATKDIEQRLQNASTPEEFERLYNAEINNLRTNPTSEEDAEIEDYRINEVKNRLKNSSSPAIKNMFNKLQVRDKIKAATEDGISKYKESDDYINLSSELKEILDLQLDSYRDSINNLNFYSSEDLINKLNETIAGWSNSKLMKKDVLEQMKKAFNKIAEIAKDIDTIKDTNQTTSTESQQEPKKESSAPTPDDSNFRLGLQGAIQNLKVEIEGFKKNPTEESFEDISKKIDKVVASIKESKAANAGEWETYYNKQKAELKQLIGKPAQEATASQPQSQVPSNDPSGVVEQTEADINNISNEDDDTPLSESSESNDNETDDKQYEQQIKAAEEVMNESASPVEVLKNVVRNWINTLWNFKELIQYKKLVDYGSKLPNVAFLQKYGAFNFVDRGALADLYRLNRKPIPIHFIMSEKVKYDDYNDPILAIEKTELVDNYLKTHPECSIVPYNVNGKDYVIVGLLGAYKNANVEDKSKVNPSLQLYTEIKNKLIEEYNNNRDGKDFVSSYTTTVQHFYSGRMVLSDDTHQEGNHLLRDTEFGDPTKLKLGIGRTDGTVVAPQLGNAEIKKLNENNPTTSRAGSIWLMIKGADGIYYPMGTRVARFNKTEYDWHKPEYQNSPIIQKIREQVKIIVNPESTDEQLNTAKIELQKYFGFTAGSDGKLYNPVVYKNEEDGSRVISINPLSSQHWNDVVGEAAELNKDPEEHFMDCLMACNYRFGVSKSTLKQSDPTEYLKMLIESNIITTPLIMDHNVNGSFDMATLYNSNGEPVLSVGGKATNAENTKKYAIKTGSMQITLPSTNGLNDIYFDENGKVVVEATPNWNKLSKAEKDGCKAVWQINRGNTTNGLIPYNNVYFKENNPYIIVRSGNTYSVYKSQTQQFSNAQEQWQNGLNAVKAREQKLKEEEQQKALNKTANDVSKQSAIINAISNIINEVKKDPDIQKYLNSVSKDAQDGFNSAIEKILTKSENYDLLVTGFAMRGINITQLVENARQKVINQMQDVSVQNTQTTTTQPDKSVIESVAEQQPQRPVATPVAKPNQSGKKTLDRSKRRQLNSEVDNRKNNNTETNENAPIENTPISVIKALNNKYWTTADSKLKGEDGLKELAKYATLTEDITLDKLNELAEDFEKCKGMDHIRFENSLF